MELARVVTSDNVRLEGLWYPATGTAKQPGGIDAVIMHHGVGNNFYTPGFFEDSVQALTARGIAVLRANNRGHDTIFRNSGPGPSGGMLGAAYEMMDDCRHDFRAWLDFAAARGARRVALWGHSLGAVKAIYHAAKEKHPALAAVIASSPPRFGHATYANAPEAFEGLQAHLAEARALVAAGKGQQLIPVTRPIPLTIAAAVYVDKYGSVDDFDYTRHIPAVPVPLLVTIGAREGVDPTAAPIIPFAGTTEYLPALGKQNPHMSHLFIPGGDHWYAGCEVQLRDAVIDFLDRVPNR